jgi:hypothetical protein
MPSIAKQVAWTPTSGIKGANGASADLVPEPPPFYGATILANAGTVLNENFVNLFSCLLQVRTGLQVHTGLRDFRKLVEAKVDERL